MCIRTYLQDPVEVLTMMQASCGLLEASWLRLGASWGCLWGVLKASWSILAASWERFKGTPNVDPKPENSSPRRRESSIFKKSISEVSIDVFIRFWCQLGSILAPFSESWGVLVASWAVLGASWSVLGAAWALFEASWGRLGASWGVLAASWWRRAPQKPETGFPQGGDHLIPGPHTPSFGEPEAAWGPNLLAYV